MLIRMNAIMEIFQSYWNYTVMNNTNGFKDRDA